MGTRSIRISQFHESQEAEVATKKQQARAQAAAQAAGTSATQKAKPKKKTSRGK